MDLDDVRWLLTDEGQRVLAAATEVRDDDPLRAQSALRRTAGPAQAATGTSAM